MNEAFLNLEQEKQARILQAAFEEFAEHPYATASTNRIVKKARIGKGMLFYYFESKENLYYQLIKYGLNFIKENYLEKMEALPTDFIERCKFITTKKMILYSKTPYIFDFFAKIYVTNRLASLPEEVATEVNNAIQTGQKLLYENLDYSLLRADIPAEEAIKMMKWIFDGYEKKIIAQLKEVDISYENTLPIVEEYEVLLEMIRTIFYQ